MDDSELQAIRAARLQEMQRNSQGGGANEKGDETGSTPTNNINENILNRFLEPEAKQRLNRVRMVKPERVLGVENYLIRLFQSGGIRGKVTEEDIVDILDKIAQEERRNTSTRITFERRDYVDNGKESITKANNDSDDDFFDE